MRGYFLIGGICKGNKLFAYLPRLLFLCDVGDCNGEDLLPRTDTDVSGVEIEQSGGMSQVVYSIIMSTSTFGRIAKSLISAFLAFTSSKRALILLKRS